MQIFCFVKYVICPCIYQVYHGKKESSLESKKRIAEMQIDHIGVVVSSIEDAILYWEKVFGYKQYTKKIENTRQEVFVVFLKKEGSLPVKLLQPTNESSPVYRFSKRGGGLHHLCFKCDNIEDEISRLKDNGLRVITKPQPGEAFENEDIAFLFGKNGLNIELVDTDKRAGVIR